MLAGDLFDSEPVSAQFLSLRATAENGKLAVAAFDWSFSRDFGFRLQPVPGRSLGSFDRREIREGAPWNFPLFTVDQAQLGDLTVWLTHFGIVARDASGEVLGPIWASAPRRAPRVEARFFVDAENAVVIAPGESRMNKLILFAEARKVIREGLMGEIREIRLIPELDAVEVSSHFTAGSPLSAVVPAFVFIYDFFILIDRQTQEVRHRFVGAGGEQLPPWRQ